MKLGPGNKRKSEEMETAFANDLRNPLLEVERAAFHLSIALVTLEPSTEYYYSEDMENMVNSRYSDKSGLHVTALFIDHAFQLFSTYFRSATQFQLEFDRLRQQQRTPACGAYHGSSRKYKLKVVDGSCFVGRKKMDATLDSIFALKSLLLHKSGYSHGRYMCLSKMSEDGDAVAYLTLLDNSVKMLEEAIAAGNAPSTQQSSSLTRPRKAWDELEEDTKRRRFNEWCRREIILGGYPDDRVWNLDETAMRYLLGPCRIYMPSGQNRGEFISDEKSRVTLVVNVNSGGNFAPLMFVIKCSKGRSKKRVAGDESNTRVIKSMSLLEGFRPQDGWTEPILWTGQYTMKGGCQRICSVWYIQDMATGHVVTSQCNAWSDTARMLMYVDLILNRITQREGAGAEQHDTRHRARHNRGGHFLWMDSFSAHNNADVLESMRNAGVMAGFYPPNMTGDLQVLDLVVNRLLKQLVRRLREGELVAHFKKFKQDLIEKSEMWSAEKLLSAKFRPPKPLLHERILAMIKYVHERDQNASFRESVKRAFVVATTTATITSLHTPLIKTRTRALFRRKARA